MIRWLVMTISQPVGNDQVKIQMTLLLGLMDCMDLDIIYCCDKDFEEIHWLFGMKLFGVKSVLVFLPPRTTIPIICRVRFKISAGPRKHVNEFVRRAKLLASSDSKHIRFE